MRHTHIVLSKHVQCRNLHLHVAKTDTLSFKKPPNSSFVIFQKKAIFFAPSSTFSIFVIKPNPTNNKHTNSHKRHCTKFKAIPILPFIKRKREVISITIFLSSIMVISKYIVAATLSLNGLVNAANTTPDNVSSRLQIQVSSVHMFLNARWLKSYLDFLDLFF